MKSINWEGYNIGDIIVSLENRKLFRSIGDMFVVIGFSNDVMYYIKDTNSADSHSWRKATNTETQAYNQGITNIKEIPQNFTPQYEIY